MLVRLLVCLLRIEKIKYYLKVNALKVFLRTGFFSVLYELTEIPIKLSTMCEQQTISLFQVCMSVH